MRGLWTVTKRELRGYLTSPVAYVLVAVFLMVSGYFFYNLLCCLDQFLKMCFLISKKFIVHLCCKLFRLIDHALKFLRC